MSTVPWLLALSPFQLSLGEARQAGEDVSGFQIFPVIESHDPNTPRQILPIYEPIPFKTLKDLKTASSSYGPTSLFVISLLENISNEALTPNDWQALAKACLSPGDYLTWKLG